MKVQILVRGSNIDVTKGLREQVEHRIASSLGRFGDLIGAVVVRFSSPPDTKVGARLTRCEMQLSLRPRSVRVEGTDDDLLSVVDQVSSRASRSVARAIEREAELDPAGVLSLRSRRMER
jgi:ribosomal subunit interface protein